MINIFVDFDHADEGLIRNMNGFIPIFEYKEKGYIPVHRREWGLIETSNSYIRFLAWIKHIEPRIEDKECSISLQ